jgi:hypothetical protein
MCVRSVGKLWLKRLHHNLLHCVEGLFCISFTDAIVGAKITGKEIDYIEWGFTKKN